VKKSVSISLIPNTNPELFTLNFKQSDTDTECGLFVDIDDLEELRVVLLDFLSKDNGNKETNDDGQTA